MIYMDNAATSWPKPDSVYNSVICCMKKYGANPGRSSHKMAIEAANILLYTREMLCELFDVTDPFSMIYTYNTTDSLNLAIKGILKEGDHVITSSMEHNSVLRPLKHLEKLGVQITIVQADSKGMVDPEDIKKAIKTNTRLIVTTHASNVTGTLLPIEEIGNIARSFGIPYLVDAAQTAGVLPMSFSKLPVDLVAFPGHKGLLGPQGTGVLYIRKGIELKPIRVGGTGSQSEELYQPDFLPDRYEAGTLNTPGIAGLGAGIQYILSKGQQKLLCQQIRLEKMFLDALSQIKNVTIYGPERLEERIGIISINIKDHDSSYISNILSENYGIATRGGLHCAPLAHQTIGTFHQGTVRFSPGIFNTLEDVKLCIKAIEEISIAVK